MCAAREQLHRPPYYQRRIGRFVVVLGVANILGMGLSSVLFFSSPTSGPRTAVTSAAVWTVGLMVLFSILFTRLFRLKRRLRAARGMLCTQCGYDLSGLDENGVCPECGHTFERQSEIASWRKAVDFGGR